MSAPNIPALTIIVFEYKNQTLTRNAFHILNPTEVYGKNVSDLRAGVRIPVEPTDFVLVIVLEILIGVLSLPYIFKLGIFRPYLAFTLFAISALENNSLVF
jgi:hypothetical protein